MPTIAGHIDRYLRSSGLEAPTTPPERRPAETASRPDIADRYAGTVESPSRAPVAMLDAPAVTAAERERDTDVLLKTYRILKGNRATVTSPDGKTHTFTTPSLCTGKGDSHLDYGGKQWLWDSAAHTMLLSWSEPEVARAELEAIFANQVTSGKDKGFVPHMNYFHGDGQSVPDWAMAHYKAFLESPEGGKLVPPSRRADFCKTYWSSPVHSDITQPPILGMAAAELYRATGDKQTLRQMLPKLSAYYDYLHDRRADSDGLVRIVHPWESGWDNSQRWDEAIGLGRASGPVPRSRIDDKKMHLFCLYKAMDWDLDKILERGAFSVKPVDYNVLYAKNMQCLSKLYRAVGDDNNAVKYEDRAGRVEQTIFREMWDGDKYCDLITSGGQQHKSQVKSAAMFYPLMLEGEPHGKELIGRHLANPKEFNPQHGFSVPTTALDDPSQEGDNYWRGNIWVIANFFVRCGLEQYLEQHPGDLLARSMSERIRSSTMEVLHRGDFYEYFNPEVDASGKVHGYGVPSFGWNGLAVLMNKTPAFME